MLQCVSCIPFVVVVLTPVMCAVLMPFELGEQAGKDVQAGVDLASLEKAGREAEAAHAQLQGELKRLRGEHSNLQVCILRVPYSLPESPCVKDTLRT